MDSTSLHPGVNAKLFWGSGIMVATLQLEPNAKIPEEVLPADRFVFVLEGSIDQLINGSPVTMIGQKREEPDGTHSATPRTDFVYLEKGTKNAVTAGASGAKLLEVYSPLRLDYLQKAGVKNLPSELADVETTLDTKCYSRIKFMICTISNLQNCRRCSFKIGFRKKYAIEFYFNGSEFNFPASYTS